MAYYIGGFTWGGESQLDRFLSDGIWENGYGEDRYQDLFNKIQAGDLFALKSTYVQDNKSWLKIYKIGKVKEVVMPSTLKIDWLNLPEKKLTDIRWYANTLERIEDKEHINRIFGQAIKRIAMNNFTNIIEHKKQIIFQGAPGTGKTYSAKDVAEELIFNEISTDKSQQAMRLELSEQFKLVQFHPSYTYEDFVRGIVVETDNSQPKYTTCNKTLGKFADKALTNWRNARKQPEVLSKEKWVESNLKAFKEMLQEKLENGEEVKLKEGKIPLITAVEEDAFRINRYSNPDDSDLMKDRDIINGYIGLYLSDPSIRIKDNTDLSRSARSGMYYLYQNLINLFGSYLRENNISYTHQTDEQPVKENKYVLIIDEINRANLPAVLGELIYALEYRGEKVESMYAVENMYAVDEDKGLILPPNLYIIGTMNTADRSVGQIDYAIRRRFAFIDVLPKVLTDVPFDIDLFKKVSAFFIKNVEDYMNNPENTVLQKSDWLSDEFSPEDVWIGHSYFIIKDDNRDLRLNYEIKPILREYLKDGILKESVNGESAKEKINNL